MHEGLGQLLNHLPPKTAGALVQAINRCGAQLEIGPDWVRRWIGFTVVADALAQYKPNVFELKGGAAIELRLRRFDGAAVRPRATRDLDATFRGELDEIEGAVRAALAEPRHGFAFRLETDDRPVERMRRLTVHVSYRVERFYDALDHACRRVQEHLGHITTHQGVLALLAALRERSGRRRDRIVVQEKKRGIFHVIRTRDIDWIEANNGGVLIHVGKNAFASRHTLAEMESGSSQMCLCGSTARISSTARASPR